MEEKFNLCNSMRKENELAKKYYEMRELNDEACKILSFCDEIELEEIKKSYSEGAWNKLKIWDAESQKYLRNKRKLCKSATQEEAEDEILFMFRDSKAVDENFKKLFDAQIDRKVFKENLNEATRQQKQIETILLNMTDGIIAFNMDGKIIHINLLF